MEKQGEHVGLASSLKGSNLTCASIHGRRTTTVFAVVVMPVPDPRDAADQD